MSRIKTFKNWILLFECVDYPIGDLAKDIKSDPNFPNSTDQNIVTDYLENRTNNPDVLKTFNDAWDYYLKSR